MIRVLVVASDPVAASLYRGAVDGLDGFETAGVAHTSASASAEMRRHRPDVVLLDVFELDGEVATPAGAPVPIVALTSATDFERPAAVQRGVTRWLLKPFPPDLLRRALEHSVGATDSRD